MAKHEYTDDMAKADAERILERTLRRRNWTVGLRDDLAAALRGVVRREHVASLRESRTNDGHT